MYTKIINPYTNIKVSIFSKQSKIVLRQVFTQSVKKSQKNTYS